MSQVTKKCRVANDGDIISNLPESVICHILSRLPSEDAFRTHILSKDWEYKWTSIYNVDVRDMGRARKREVFVEFVDRILFFSHDLKSFRLSCDIKYPPRRLTLWICAAFRRNIESFELSLRLQKGYVLPRILNNNSLSKMKIISTCTFEVPLSNSFPNLTYLYLERVEILNKLSSSDSLVFIFPVLKTLELVECKWSNVNLVEIYSPSLTIFYCVADWKCGINGYPIKICGANLEKFSSYGGYPENFILYESMARNAYLGNNPHQQHTELQSGVQIRKLLKGFSTVACLSLSTYICKAAAKSKQELLLPQYNMLQRLYINVIYNAELLLEFLHSAPSLKFLGIHQDRDCSEEFDCDVVDHVPCCVISHLEEVNFSRIHEKPLFHLALFFLKNGVKLKKVYLTDYFSRKVRLAQQISKFPRSSTCVEIVTR